ncbi:IS110 family RNA-guided transposase [Flavisolibacter nicotianae]|uniref:IS110 family transposase n=1 Tax=Flavisolibacter nicotianae TaxID=2364882 RepID=UPI000EAC96EE|nr:IS110 family transposase [Flavisolibacter nicotianae]
MQKRSTKNKVPNGLPLVHANAAGIDIGDTFHAVAVPEGRDEQRVRTFGSMTCDLLAIAGWLKQCNIDTVAMESTGVYWKPLFGVLIKEGFEVYLVNSRHVRNVSGRKNDEDDAMWIQRLHSCALLKSSFLPSDEQESLRAMVRFRRTLTQDQSRFVLRMQKAMELMNVKLHTVINDITGQSGLAVISAVLAGERNPEKLQTFVGKTVKADRETIIKSLQGTWRSEQLFLLKECYQCYCYYKERITICDQEIERQLQTYQKAEPLQVGPKENLAPALSNAKKRAHKNTPQFDTRAFLQAIHGVDVTAIYGMGEGTALEILFETGANLSKWPTAKHFISWLNLCPNNKITGGKLISSMLLKKTPNVASQAFRHAANAV